MEIEQINKLTKTAYDKTAEKYHENFKDELEQKECDRSILDRFSAELPKNAVVCDAGCGPSGNFCKYLSDKGHKVIGIDISEKCIEIASANNPDISFKMMDMMKTDFSPASFDGIVAFYSILYTPKKYVGRIFAEFNRILRPNGKLLIVVKRGTQEGLINNEWYEGNTVYFTHFTETEIVNLLTENGFEINLLEVRKPLNFEIQVDRIYVIGSKKISK